MDHYTKEQCPEGMFSLLKQRTNRKLKVTFRLGQFLLVYARLYCIFMLLFLKVTCGLGACVNPPLLSWSLLMPGLKSVLSEYGLALKVSAEICRISGLTYKATAVGHRRGVYLYWTTVMWLGDRKNLVLLLISWDAKCCLNLVWFEFSHRTLKLSDRTYAKLSLWTMLTQSNYSSPQLSSDP